MKRRRFWVSLAGLGAGALGVKAKPNHEAAEKVVESQQVWSGNISPNRLWGAYYENIRQRATILSREQEAYTMIALASSDFQTAAECAVRKAKADALIKTIDTMLA
jgi:hypothetical protein